MSGGEWTSTHIPTCFYTTQSSAVTHMHAVIDYQGVPREDIGMEIKRRIFGGLWINQFQKEPETKSPIAKLCGRYTHTYHARKNRHTHPHTHTHTPWSTQVQGDDDDADEPNIHKLFWPVHHAFLTVLHNFHKHHLPKMPIRFDIANCAKSYIHSKIASTATNQSATRFWPPVTVHVEWSITQKANKGRDIGNRRCCRLVGLPVEDS